MRLGTREILWMKDQFSGKLFGDNLGWASSEILPEQALSADIRDTELIISMAMTITILDQSPIGDCTNRTPGYSQNKEVGSETEGSVTSGESSASWLQDVNCGSRL